MVEMIENQNMLPDLRESALAVALGGEKIYSRGS
jgi:hypothetical protein